MDLSKKIIAHRVYEINRVGIDYFIGDLHGEYELFLKLMSIIEFDEKKDRVFSVGDLIDRGKCSYECLNLASNNWFIPVLGNHEEMLLSSLNNQYMKYIWKENGGGWWDDLKDKDKFALIDILIDKFSVTATIETVCGSVGLVHADYFFNKWPFDFEKWDSNLIKNLLWSRQTITTGTKSRVRGVDLLVSGHTPIKKPVIISNHLFLDTGCGHSPNESITNPKLTIAKMSPNGVEISMLGKKDFRSLLLNFSK